MKVESAYGIQVIHWLKNMFAVVQYFLSAMPMETFRLNILLVKIIYILVMLLCHKPHSFYSMTFAIQ